MAKRPKITDPYKDRIIAASDSGMSSPQISAEIGLHQRVIQRVIQDERIRREAEAQIDPTTLSMSAQQKLDAAIRQHKHKFELEFDLRVREEVRKRINEMVLPEYNRTYEEYQQVIKSRKGIMDKETFKKIWQCLHPDRVSFLKDVDLIKRYEEAFNLFSAMELLLLDEKQKPTSTFNMPTTYEKMYAMMRKAKSENAA